jgi:hypothetical protein
VIPGRLGPAAKSKLILIRYVAPPSYFAYRYIHCPICSRDFPFTTLADGKTVSNVYKVIKL